MATDDGDGPVAAVEEEETRMKWASIIHVHSIMPPQLHPLVDTLNFVSRRRRRLWKAFKSQVQSSSSRMTPLQGSPEWTGLERVRQCEV